MPVPYIGVGRAVGAGTTTALDVAKFMNFGSLSVVCVVKISNYTKWSLNKPLVTFQTGQARDAPKEIGPGKEDMFLFHKTPNVLAGSGGTVSWEVNNEEEVQDQNQKRELLIMWQVPFWNSIFSTDLLSSQNTLAVGTMKGGTHVEKGKQLYQDMYSSTGTFVRGKFKNTLRTIVYDCEESGVQIKATMGSGCRCEVTVDIYPLDGKGLHEDDIVSEHL